MRLNYKITENVPVVVRGTTLADVERELFKRAKELETINYIYVVDQNRRFLGAVSIKELFRSPKDRKVESFITQEPIKVKIGTARERIASTAIHHSIKAVPIVEKDEKLIGVVTSDEIHRILHTDHTETFLRSAGVHTFADLTKDIVSASASAHIRRRLPWLVVGLLGGIIAAMIVGLFEETLQAFALLVAFIPAIVYIADAVGAQTQTIFIRSLAINPALNVKKYLYREFLVNLALSIVLAGAMAAFALVWHQSQILGAILGISFILTIMVAMALAVFLPLLFLRIKIDPAVASGPFATVLRDIASLLVYFAVASIILGLT
ncbi:MAG: magnesium transporter [Candidatus Colwellbacteria bacterium]|nr:magnesium transporter [Candidatus Colwellbacteria bacterium]